MDYDLKYNDGKVCVSVYLEHEQMGSLKVDACIELIAILHLVADSTSTKWDDALVKYLEKLL